MMDEKPFGKLIEAGKGDMIVNDDKFEDLLGKTLIGVEVHDDSIVFITKDAQYQLYHEQDCCESVYVEDIIGDVDDLIGSPLLMAEEVTNADEPVDSKVDKSYRDYSETWTFYKLATIKGYVTIRWYGSSNGYYSESVTFAKIS